MPDTEKSGAEWLVLRHLEHEHLGTVARSLGQRGIVYSYVDTFRGDAVPSDIGAHGGLIVMGGPMGVYESDRYPFLAQEQELIRRAAGAGRPVLGICLGSQLIAAAFGARVYPGSQKEIGWYAVEVTAPDDPLAAGLPPRFMGFHWHGDTFDLPAGATRLFRSSLYENQGFRIGSNVLALQFHFEVTAAMISEWLADAGCSAELAALPGASADTIRSQTTAWGAQLEVLSAAIFGRFVTLNEQR